MKAVVTGAAGFIGSHLCEHLLAQGHDVIGIDALSGYYDVGSKRRNLIALSRHGSFKFKLADLTTADLTRLFGSADAVFHLAAQPGVRASWGKGFQSYVLNNVLATQRVLEAALALRIGKVVYASSSSVYGEAEAYPTTESVRPRPISPYGVTKLAAEHLCYLYWKNHAVPVTSVRYFTVFGPRQRPDMAFSRLVDAALSGASFEVYGDGRQTRDFTFVADAVAGTLLAQAVGSNGDVYNIGGGSQTTLRQVIDTLEGIVGRKVVLKASPPQQGDVRDTAADITHAKNHLGYVPSISLEQGLRAQVDWVRQSRP